MPFPVLRRDSKGPEVKRWQLFLIGQGFHPGPADGAFGKDTETATRNFQQSHALQTDGKVGNQTLGTAMTLGFEIVKDTDDSRLGPNYPPPPGFPPLSSNADRQRVFGKFTYSANPLPNNPENILITGTWQRDNIIPVPLPQLAGIKGAPRSGNVSFHRLGAPQLQALFAAWQKARLLNRVLDWGGSFVPRFVRGSTTTLSNHSFGSAFDINVSYNALGAEPARYGQPGCVRELVTIANEHGFYWGGHFSRRDGMHFEIAKLLD